MRKETLPIEGLAVYIPDVFPDERGRFFELYREEMYGIGPFVQDNISVSKKHVLRGLHMQEGMGKFVTVLDGEILDVAVDLREGSPTYKKWHSVVLSSENTKQFWIPPGFLHGFVVLSTSATVLYKCTVPYRPENEEGVRWDDPTLAVEWGVEFPILSERDANLPLLRQRL